MPTATVTPPRCPSPLMHTTFIRCLNAPPDPATAHTLAALAAEPALRAAALLLIHHWPRRYAKLWRYVADATKNPDAHVLALAGSWAANQARHSLRHYRHLRRHHPDLLPTARTAARQAHRGNVPHHPLPLPLTIR